jgi:carbon starvation protein CstA
VTNVEGFAVLSRKICETSATPKIFDGEKEAKLMAHGAFVAESISAKMEIDKWCPLRSKSL